MSILGVGYAIKEAPYGGARLLVLIALENYTNKEGFAWPTMKSIAEDARCSPQYARASIRQFEKDGWVRTLEGRGLKHGNTYWVKTASEARFPGFGKTAPLDTENRAFGSFSGHLTEPSKEPRAPAREEEQENSLERTPVSVEEQSKEQEQELKSKEPKSKEQKNEELQTAKGLEQEQEQKSKRTARPDPKPPARPRTPRARAAAGSRKGGRPKGGEKKGGRSDIRTGGSTSDPEPTRWGEALGI